MDNQNIRWIQRLNNYEKALNELLAEIEDISKRESSKLEKKGIIQSFEIVQDLSWKVIKDFFAIQGDESIYGSRDAFQKAFKNGLVADGQTFMDTIKSRNLTSHTYDEEISEKIYLDIVNRYCTIFDQLRVAMVKEKEERGL